MCMSTNVWSSVVELPSVKDEDDNEWMLALGGSRTMSTPEKLLPCNMLHPSVVDRVSLSEYFTYVNMKG